MKTHTTKLEEVETSKEIIEGVVEEMYKIYGFLQPDGTITIVSGNDTHDVDIQDWLREKMNSLHKKIIEADLQHLKELQDEWVEMCKKDNKDLWAWSKVTLLEVLMMRKRRELNTLITTKRDELKELDK